MTMDRTTTQIPVVMAADILVLADVLDDIEKAKIAVGNRHQALTTPEVVRTDRKGGRYGKGLPADSPEALTIAGLHDALDKLNRQASARLVKAMRSHPLGPWIDATHGIGHKSVGRFLAAVGDPTTRRTVSQLWAYSGLHVVLGSADTPSAGDGVKRGGNTDQSIRETQRESVGVAPRLTKGKQSNWSLTAKTRAYLMALAAIKQQASPYRKVYELRRTHTAETHPDWTDIHSHNDGLRITAKAIVRDIWIESRRTRSATLEPLRLSSGDSRS